MIVQRRLLEAKRLLLFTVRPLEDIAYEVGLKDAAYYYCGFPVLELGCHRANGACSIRHRGEYESLFNM